MRSPAPRTAPVPIPAVHARPLDHGRRVRDRRRAVPQAARHV